MKAQNTHPMSLLTFNRFIVQGMFDDGLTKPERKKLWKETRFTGFFTKQEWDSEVDRMKYSGMVFIDKHVYVFCEGKIYFAGGILANYNYNLRALLNLKGEALTIKHLPKIFVNISESYLLTCPEDETFATELFQLSKIV